MKWLNFGRCCGKTSLMIATSFATGMPIIVKDLKRKDLLFKQSKEMGVEGIVAFTLDEWVANGFHRNYKDPKILIDEVSDIVETALNYYLKAEVVSATMTVPMIKKEETE